MKVALTAGAIVLAVLAIAIGPASAQFDRADIADGTWAQTSVATGAGPSTFNRFRSGRLYVNNFYGGTQNTMSAHALVSGTTTGVGAASNMGTASLRILLYEPEKAGRKSDQAKIQQKTGVGAIAAMNAVGSITTTIGVSVVIDNCSMKASGKGTAGGAVNKAQVKIKCPDILGGSGLNLNANQTTALARILGLAAITDKELSVKSKTATFTAGL